jgi:hypothetical protein
MGSYAVVRGQPVVFVLTAAESTVAACGRGSRLRERRDSNPRPPA